MLPLSNITKKIAVLFASLSVSYRTGIPSSHKNIARNEGQVIGYVDTYCFLLKGIPVC